MALDVSQIKDPKLRARIEAADSEQNGAVSAGSPPARSVKSAAAPRRLRQSTKPLMNKLEAEFYERLKMLKTPVHFRAQSMRFRLGNGIWYKPDFTAWHNHLYHEAMPANGIQIRMIAWEVKGPRAFRGGFENLKVAAALYPEVRWLLVWKDKATGEWQEQCILP